MAREDQQISANDTADDNSALEKRLKEEVESPNKYEMICYGVGSDTRKYIFGRRETQLQRGGYYSTVFGARNSCLAQETES